MKRNLKITLSIDYNKLMVDNKIIMEQSGCCSKEEDEVVRRIINEIAARVDLKKAEVVIQDWEKTSYESFERSNKMGASSSHGFVFNNDAEEKEGEQ